LIVRNHNTRDNHLVVVFLLCLLSMAIFALVYPRLNLGSAEPGESNGYTYYVMDGTTEIVYELEKRPEWHDGIVHLHHKGAEIWISGNWTAYKMMNK
jgi:hypothetical protein